jgi:hypothetical protein
MIPQGQLVPASLSGTLVAFQLIQRTGEIAVADGSLFSLFFTSVVQEQFLSVGSRLVVSGVVSSKVVLFVQTVRVVGISTRVLVRGMVARCLSGGGVELLDPSGATMVIQTGRACVSPLQARAALVCPLTALPSSNAAAASSAIVLGDQLATSVMLTNTGAVVMGTTTVLPPLPQPSLAVPLPQQLTALGRIIAVDIKAGQDGGGLTTVVVVGAAAASYTVGLQVAVLGIPTGLQCGTLTVQAKVIKLLVAPPRPATITVKGTITVVDLVSGTITLQDVLGRTIVIAVQPVNIFAVGQKVAVVGIVTSAGPSLVTVQAQSFKVEPPESDD